MSFPNEYHNFHDAESQIQKRGTLTSWRTFLIGAAVGSILGPLIAIKMTSKTETSEENNALPVGRSIRLAPDDIRITQRARGQTDQRLQIEFSNQAIDLMPNALKTEWKITNSASNPQHEPLPTMTDLKGKIANILKRPTSVTCAAFAFKGNEDMTFITMSSGENAYSKAFNAINLIRHEGIIVSWPVCSGPGLAPSVRL